MAKQPKQATTKAPPEPEDDQNAADETEALDPRDIASLTGKPPDADGTHCPLFPQLEIADVTYLQVYRVEEDDSGRVRRVLVPHRFPPAADDASIGDVCGGGEFIVFARANRKGGWIAQTVVDIDGEPRVIAAPQKAAATSSDALAQQFGEVLLLKGMDPMLGFVFTLCQQQVSMVRADAKAMIEACTQMAQAFAGRPADVTASSGELVRELRNDSREHRRIALEATEELLRLRTRGLSSGEDKEESGMMEKATDLIAQKVLGVLAQAQEAQK